MQVHLASLGLDFEALGISQDGNDSGHGSRSPDMRAASENGALICSIGRKIANKRGGMVMGSSPAALHTYKETNSKSEVEVEILVFKSSRVLYQQSLRKSRVSSMEFSLFGKVVAVLFDYWADRLPCNSLNVRN